MRSAGSWPASRKAFSKARFWLSVSTVPPDLLETTTTVRARSCSMAVRTKSGSEESRTTTSTPWHSQMTSGASEEPPIPHRTTRVSPRPWSSSRRARTSATRLREESARPTQASRLPASSSAAGPHRVGSWAAIREAKRSSTRRPTVSAYAASSG
jgi:hypothetical protein